ncbi:MAG TPA: glycosyltransferase family 87 protein [Gemmatimonadales bacterium]|nr:glycosyltransferase family 87 protein [Gemmatimonadales bacterium]
MAGLALVAARGGQAIAAYAVGPKVDSVWLYDWRVHYAGALDFLERDLYQDGGIGVGALKMPVDVFNLPPASAALALPFALLGYDVGGLAWVVLGIVGVVGAGAGAARMAGRSTWLAWFGLFWLAYALQPFFVRVTVLGNVNSFMLPLVVGFVWAHLKGHQRLAGILLGLSVTIKIWPILIGGMLIRERRWRELAWAALVLAALGIPILLWLGPDVVPDIVSALRTQVPIPDGVLVVWTSWARESLSWWPAWGSLAVAAVLIGIPARGRLGLGLGILAGLSLIANLWDHYLPTFAFAALLLLSSGEVERLAQALRSRLSRRRSHVGVMPVG